MKLLLDPPPGFQATARAWEMARLLPSTHKLALRLGLAHEGHLFATCELHGYRQVKYFCEHLRSRGWHEHLLGDDVDMFGCDLLFSHPGDPLEAQPSDPSFIRRPAVRLWPARR